MESMHSNTRAGSTLSCERVVGTGVLSWREKSPKVDSRCRNWGVILEGKVP